MKKMNRRGFIKRVGAAGLGSALGAASLMGAAGAAPTETETSAATIPTRPFGKTGVHVSILGFGGSHDIIAKQLLMRQAFKMGVTYWDTANGYAGSEEGMGKYFEKFPEDRKKIFLVTKGSSSDPAKLDQLLTTSLERLRCDHVDLYFIHGVYNVERGLPQEVKQWAERAKSKGRIRFFGFSTHKNMEQCLLDGAKLGWVDGIMASYNYRLMHTAEMKRAVDACVKAGIGLTAMKSQARAAYRPWVSVGTADDTAAMIDQFSKRGFSVEQAKLKAVWANPLIATVCSEMPSMTILTANATAAMDKISLSIQDRQLLQRHAQQTAAYYCTGCAQQCETVPGCNIPISDVLRGMMYAHGYGDREKARRTLRQLGYDVLVQLPLADYTAAEQACPRRLPIAELMRAALGLFT
jgi:uncharacterized protein